MAEESTQAVELDICSHEGGGSHNDDSQNPIHDDALQDHTAAAQRIVDDKNDQRIGREPAKPAFIGENQKLGGEQPEEDDNDQNLGGKTREDGHCQQPRTESRESDNNNQQLGREPDMIHGMESEAHTVVSNESFER
jgi:hypothetical protein